MEPGRTRVPGMRTRKEQILDVTKDVASLWGRAGRDQYRRAHGLHAFGRALGRLLLIPWKVLDRVLDRSTTVEILRTTATQQGIGGMIFLLLFFPFFAAYDLTEVSNIGNSEQEESNLAFWFTFGWVGLIAVLGFVIWLAI